MADAFRLQVRGRKPVLYGANYFERDSYRFSRAQSFRWDDLVEIARVNGFTLTRPLLHKWRVWRFLPAPVAGGRTGHGRGKGQTWPIGAGWRVAWISHWLASTLTYDALRIAIWPWTPAFDSERIDDVSASLVKFLRQDEAFQRAVVDHTNLDAHPEMRAYSDVVFSDDDAPLSIRRELLEASGAPDINSPPFIDNIVFMKWLNFPDMHRMAEMVTPEVLREFIAQFRIGSAEREQLYVGIFWESPLGLARTIVRELHRFALMKEGKLKKPKTE